MRSELSEPTVYRLCVVLRILEELRSKQIVISSSELSKYTNTTAYTLRKDFSLLSGVASSKSGYDIENLIFCIKSKLDIGIAKYAAIAGLGRIGMAILNYTDSRIKGYDIVAGFDASVNKLETLHTDIPLYPAYDIEDIVRELKIKLAVIAVPADKAQEIALRFIKGGVEGIINFAPVIIKTDVDTVYIKNIDLVTEFNFLSSIVKTKGE